MIAGEDFLSRLDGWLAGRSVGWLAVLPRWPAGGLVAW